MAKIKYKPKSQFKRVRPKGYLYHAKGSSGPIKISRYALVASDELGAKKKNLKPSNYPANEPIETKGK